MSTASLMGPLPLLPRHGWLRRNAVSPVGVRLGGAPGAPLLMGCSSANRVLASRLGWDGIVAVPRVFTAGWPYSSRTRRLVGLPGGCNPGMRASGAAAWTLSDSSPQLADTRQRTEVRKGVAVIVDIGGCQKHRGLTLAPAGRSDGSTGLAGSPQVAENHGRTISERHNRTPRRRVCGARGCPRWHFGAPCGSRRIIGGGLGA
jgi:hypothetical protein